MNRTGLSCLVMAVALSLAAAVVFPADEEKNETARPADEEKNQTARPADEEKNGTVRPVDEEKKKAARPADDFESRSAATRKLLTRRKMNIDLRAVPLQDTLEMLAVQAGIELRLHGRMNKESMQKPVSLKLENSSLFAVLHWLFKRQNLAWAVEGDGVVVAAPEFLDRAAGREQARYVKETEDNWLKIARARIANEKLSVDIRSKVPIARILHLVARRCKLNVIWDEKAKPLRKKMVGLRLTDTSVETLLMRLTEAAGVKWHLEAEAVVISVK